MFPENSLLLVALMSCPGYTQLSPQIKGRLFFHFHILYLSFAEVNKLKPLVPFALSLFSEEQPLII